VDHPPLRSATPLVAGVLLGAALGCAGVGSAPTASKASTAPPPTPADAPAPPSDTPGGRGLAGVRQRGVLRVAADPDSAPFLSKNPKGEWEGFEYGIIQGLEDRIGTPVTIVPTPFPELTRRVTEGAADLAIGQISPSDTYTGVGWSVSYLQWSLCLVVPAQSPVKWAADLPGKRVGMYDDPVAKQIADSIIGAPYEPVLFTDYGYFEKMVHGQLDAMLYDCPLARSEMKVYGSALRVADDAINVATYNVAVPTEGATLLAAVNGVLKGMGDDGQLRDLEARWLGAPPPKAGYRTARGRVVVAGAGEKLGPIAGRELGSADRWKDVYAVNQDIVGTDPDAVYAGMRLRVPTEGATTGR
jgi:ABC-type amino acid transport substrate-binding protein